MKPQLIIQKKKIILTPKPNSMRRMNPKAMALENKKNLDVKIA